MGLIKSAVTGVVMAIGSELILKRVLPAAIKKGKKIVKDLEEKAKEKGEITRV